MPYNEVAERSRALTGWLVAEGDRVALLSSNRAEFAVGHYAVARAGAIAVPLSARSTPDELERVLTHAEVSLALAEEEFKARRFLATLESLRARVPTLGPVASLDDARELRARIQPDDRLLQERQGNARALRR